MLLRQKHKAMFTGGLEAARLKPWHVGMLKILKPSAMYFAYDTKDDLEPLQMAGRMLKEEGFNLATNHTMHAYTLCGYPGDTFDLAEQRMLACLDANFLPMAMLFRDKQGNTEQRWRQFQREWANPIILGVKAKEFLAGRRTWL